MRTSLFLILFTASSATPSHIARRDDSASLLQVDAVLAPVNSQQNEAWEKNEADAEDALMAVETGVPTLSEAYGVRQYAVRTLQAADDAAREAYRTENKALTIDWSASAEQVQKRVDLLMEKAPGASSAILAALADPRTGNNSHAAEDNLREVCEIFFDSWETFANLSSDLRGALPAATREPAELLMASMMLHPTLRDIFESVVDSGDYETDTPPCQIPVQVINVWSFFDRRIIVALHEYKQVVNLLADVSAEDSPYGGAVVREILKLERIQLTGIHNMITEMLRPLKEKAQSLGCSWTVRGPM